MTFETPCGLLVQGNRFNNGYMSFMGIDWRTENDNPVACCPRFSTDFCAMRHPMLWSESLESRSGIVRQCACHRTDRPYTYAGSLDEAHDRVLAEADELWKLFKARHKGRVCKLQSYYDRTAKTLCAEVYQFIPQGLVKIQLAMAVQQEPADHMVLRVPHNRLTERQGYARVNGYGLWKNLCWPAAWTT